MMPQRLRNPLRGSWHPLAVSKRVTNFLLLGLATLFVRTNRRIFLRIVARHTGATDPRVLPAAPRRVSFCLCCGGTFFLFLATVYLFASSWNTLWAAGAAIALYVATALALTRAWWRPRAAFRGYGRIAGVLHRAWDVIRHGPP